MWARTVECLTRTLLHPLCSGVPVYQLGDDDGPDMALMCQTWHPPDTMGDTSTRALDSTHLTNEFFKILILIPLPRVTALKSQVAPPTQAPDAEEAPSSMRTRSLNNP